MKFSHALVLALALTCVFAIPQHKLKQAKKFLQVANPSPPTGPPPSQDVVEWFLEEENQDAFKSVSDFTFNHLDFDQSGFISPHENNVGIAYICGWFQIPPPTPLEVLETFAEIDTEGGVDADGNPVADGQLNDDEFFKGFKKLAEHVLSELEAQNNSSSSSSSQGGLPHNLMKVKTLIKTKLNSKAHAKTKTHSKSKTHAKFDGEGGSSDSYDGEYSDYYDYSEWSSEDGEDRRPKSWEIEWLLEPEHRDVVYELTDTIFYFLDFNESGDLTLDEVDIGVAYMSGEFEIPPPSFYDVQRVFDDVNICGNDVALDHEEFNRGFRKFLRYVARELRYQEEQYFLSTLPAYNSTNSTNSTTAVV